MVCHFVFWVVRIDLRGCQQVTLYHDGLGLKPSSILTSALLTRAWDLSLGYILYEPWHNVVIGSLVASVAGFLLGCFAPFFLIDVQGRKPIQFLGLAILTVILALLAKMSTHQVVVRRVR